MIFPRRWENHCISEKNQYVIKGTFKTVRTTKEFLEIQSLMVKNKEYKDKIKEISKILE